MKSDKRFYKASEVEKIVSGVSSDYEKKIAEMRNAISELSENNLKLANELEGYKEREELINESIENATESAAKIRRNAEKKYAAEVDSLKKFASRWRGYFSYLYKKYPLYDTVKESKTVFDKLAKLLAKAEDRRVIEEFSDVLDKSAVNKGVFDPKQKINDYIAATSDNGFNLDEVLNPGELELEDLCKELGLIDEDK